MQCTISITLCNGASTQSSRQSSSIIRSGLRGFEAAYKERRIAARQRASSHTHTAIYSDMDPALYKNFTVSRGFKYTYYASPAKAGKPTLLFCHGFPSTARDWRCFVPFFQTRGYGLIVPDMLGYGGTDKPTDPAAYLSRAMSRDLVDLLDAEGVDTAIAIGHDW